MAIYALGDVHGCFRTLVRLLERLPFETGRDQLWLTGDLVNRGPQSLEVLRWAETASRDLGERFVTVLGNHDLHLLASAAGFGRPHHQALLAAVLEAPDGGMLVEWLAHRPLIHRQGSTALVHAGLFPDWTLEDAEARARRLEAMLRDASARTELFRSMASDRGQAPRDLHGFTGMRTLTIDGEPSDYTGPPEQAPQGFLPWFEIPERKSRTATLIAGHWAALGLRLEPNFVALDSGCVYGGALTAVRLDDRAVFAEPNAEGKADERERVMK